MYIIIVSDHVLLLSLLHSSWIKAIVKELRSQIVRMLYLRDQVPDTLGHLRDAGSHVAHCLPESEVGSWQNTVPASVEDQLLLQLNELSVREICLQDLKWVFIDIDIHLVLGRGLIFVGYWR